MQILRAVLLSFFMLPLLSGAGNAVANYSFDTAAQHGYRRYDNYLALHAIQPAHRIRWDSSRSVLLSYGKNILNKKLTGRRHSMGHVSFELACTAQGQKRHIFTGQIEESLDDFISSLKEGQGLSLFFTKTKGRLQNAADLEEEYSTLVHKANNMNIVAFRLNPRACQNAMEFFDSYQESGAHTNYGLSLRPLLLEGGGCASLGAAMAHKAGVSADYIAAWRQTIKLPLEGFAQDDKVIKLKRLITKPFSFDVNLPDPAISVSFYDPQLIYDWTKKTYRAGRPGEKYQFAATPVIVLDAAPKYPSISAAP